MKSISACSIVAAAVLLAGCETLSLTALGIGGSAAVNQRMSGSPTRTFTAPLNKVRLAAFAALKRMGVRAQGTKKIESGELIFASAGDRDIEVELEVITPSATRMKVVARRSGLFNYDGSTAIEIILQTEKHLGGRSA